MLLITSRKLKKLCKDFIQQGDSQLVNSYDPTYWNWVAHAAAKNYPSIIKYAYETGYRWAHGLNISRLLAINGNLECLKYVHEHGCAWDEDTTAHAAENGRLDILMYAHEHVSTKKNILFKFSALSIES